MEHQKIFGQMINFQKTAFTNTFDAVVGLQEQGEKLLSASLEQNQLIPKDQKKIMSDWTETYKTNRQNLKEAVDANFEMLQGLVGKDGTKPTPKGKHS
ncbi:MAG: hypothetical protein GY710_22935 [Desulfobacteraceae bacterium]|nr:hypothetical protein [Desulfobacteraceae bacterium]